MSMSRTMVTTCENAQCLLMLLDKTVISRFAIRTTYGIDAVPIEEMEREVLFQLFVQRLDSPS